MCDIFKRRELVSGDASKVVLYAACNYCVGTLIVMIDVMTIEKAPPPFDAACRVTNEPEPATRPPLSWRFYWPAAW